MPIQLNVTVPDNTKPDWVERLLNRELYRLGRTQAERTALKSLSRMYPDDFGRLMSEAIDKLAPKSHIDVKVIPTPLQHK